MNIHYNYPKRKTTELFQLNQIYAALLRTKPYQLQIKRCITGATNGHLSLNDVELLPLPNIVDAEIKRTISNQLSLSDGRFTFFPEVILGVNMCITEVDIEKINVLRETVRAENKSLRTTINGIKYIIKRNAVKTENNDLAFDVTQTLCK
jgi:hypothetical protein